MQATRWAVSLAAALLLTQLAAGSSHAQDIPRELPEELLQLQTGLSSPIDPDTAWPALINHLFGTPHAEPWSIGSSAASRQLDAVRIGTGSLTVLLWISPDDLSGAGTRGLARVLTHLATSSSPAARRIRSELVIVGVPLLNPDGMERGTARNAQGLDLMWQGQRRWAPEMQALFELAAELAPHVTLSLEVHEGELREHLTELPAAAGANPTLVRGAAYARGLAVLAARGAELPGTFVESSGSPFSSLQQLRASGSAGVHVRIRAGGSDEDRELEAARYLWNALASLLEGVTAVAPETVLAMPAPPLRQVDRLLLNAAIHIPGLPLFVADVAIDEGQDETGVTLVDIGNLHGRYSARDTVNLHGRAVVFEARDFPKAHEGRPFTPVSGPVRFSVRTHFGFTAATQSKVVGGRLLSEREIWETHGGAYVTALVPGTTAGLLVAGHGLASMMESDGWGADYDRAYPERVAEGFWAFSLGRRFSPRLRAEAMVLLLQRGNVRGMNTDLGSVLDASYRSTGISLLPIYDLGPLRAGAGAALVTGSYTLSKPMTGPAPRERQDETFRLLGASAELVVPLLRFSRMETEFRLHGQFFPPLEVAAFGDFPGGRASMTTLVSGLAVSTRLFR